MNRLIKKITFISQRVLVALLVFGTVYSGFPLDVFLNTHFRPEQAQAASVDAIRQEINILDGVLSAATGVFATSSEIIQLDTTQYNGATYYFEVVADTTLSLQATVNLRRTTGETDATYTLPLLQTTYGRFRTGSFTPPAGQTNYVVTIGNEVGATKNVKAARIIVLQSATTITNTETQIEIGDNEAVTNGIATSTLNSPKYWQYNSSKWNGGPTYYAEVDYSLQQGYVASTTLYTNLGITTWRARDGAIRDRGRSVTRRGCGAIGTDGVRGGVERLGVGPQ